MASKMSPNFQLGEVKLKVSHLQRSLAFYQDVIGFQVLKQEGRQAYLTADGKQTLVVLEEVPDAVVTPPRSASGLYHFAILLPSRKDLGAFLRKLIHQEVYLGQADHLVSEALYLSDPDHNGIEVYRDRPRDRWQVDSNGSIQMATEPLDIRGLLEESQHTEWNGLPAETKMGHIHLHVSDLAKSRHFYCDLLGFDLILDWHGALFVSAGGYHHHLGLNIWAGVGAPLPPENGTGIGYYTMRIPGEDLVRVMERLEHAGIPIRKQDAETWYVQDPTGIEIKMTASTST